MFRSFSTYVGCTVSVTKVIQQSSVYAAEPYKATCKFSSSGCPVKVHIYREEKRKTHIFELVESRYWWVERGIRARETCTEIEKNKKYECDLEIDAFSVWHSATYVCIIKDKNDPNNMAKYEFFATRKY